MSNAEGVKVWLTLILALVYSVSRVKKVRAPNHPPTKNEKGTPMIKGNFKISQYLHLVFYLYLFLFKIKIFFMNYNI